MESKSKINLIQTNKCPYPSCFDTCKTRTWIQWPIMGICGVFLLQRIYFWYRHGLWLSIGQRCNILVLNIITMSSLIKPFWYANIPCLCSLLVLKGSCFFEKNMRKGLSLIFPNSWAKATKTHWAKFFCNLSYQKTIFLEFGFTISCGWHNRICCLLCPWLLYFSPIANNQSSMLLLWCDWYISFSRFGDFFCKMVGFQEVRHLCFFLKGCGE